MLVVDGHVTVDGKVLIGFVLNNKCKVILQPGHDQTHCYSGDLGELGWQQLI